MSLHIPLRWKLLVGVMLILGADASLAQSIYRCEAGGKTTYSDRPCESGSMRKVSPDGQPTAEQRAAARARLQLQLDQDAAKQQERRALELATAQAAAERRAALPPPVYEDPRDNQKQLVHSPSGWDYKTPKQIRAEEAARAARAATQPPPSRPMNPNVVNCDAGGCGGTDGTRYNRGAGNTMFGSDGRICQAVAPGAPLMCN